MVVFQEKSRGEVDLNLPSILELAEYLPSKCVCKKKAYKKIEAQAKRWSSYNAISIQSLVNSMELRGTVSPLPFLITTTGRAFSNMYNGGENPHQPLLLPHQWSMSAPTLKYPYNPVAFLPYLKYLYTYMTDNL